MAVSEVRSAAMWLGKLLAEELMYLGGITGKVETLQTDLNALAAFLTEAAKAHRDDARVRTALSQAQALAYECQDAIDAYIVKVARHGYEHYEAGCQLGFVLRWACILREAKSVHDIRSQIDALCARISTLKTDLVSYGVTALINRDDVPGPSDLLRRVYPHEREENVVVGLERDVEELVGRLMDPTDKTIITITGMGGLGKSTLAAELYRHPTLREGGYFQSFGWAHVSQRFQPNRVLRTLLYSFVDENDRDAKDKIDRDVKADQAHAALYEMMLRVKCVVVVDDIWTSQDWAKLEAAFPRRTSTGSRVILTTRYQDILSSSVSLDQDQVHLHPIKGLDSDNSWKLFKKNAFSGGICTDAAKEKLGREIIRHCKGVPLAIVVIGKALKRKDRIEDWENIYDNISAQIKRGGGSHKAYKEVYDVLQVSYDELPHHLKHCFLHLAYYPEDENIVANRLYQLLAGAGILYKENPNDRFEVEEEIAESYMEELVSRNMVQVERRLFSGKILIYKMHDLMRDVCVDIAKREGFFQTVYCKSVISLRDSLPPIRDNGLRGLAVYASSAHQNSTPSRVNMQSRAPNLRSLIVFPTGEQGDAVDCTRLMETVCEDYPLLRVFDCHGLKMTGKLPDRVGNLIHLMHLSLSGTSVTHLSSSIQKLRSLQSLALVVNVDVKNLVIPNVLWKLKQLRHLRLPTAPWLSKMKVRGTRAANLQRYSIEGGGVLKLEGLCNLRTLVFIDLDRVDFKGVSNLKTLKHIEAMCESNKELLHALLELRTISTFNLVVHAKIINEDPSILSRCQVLDYLDLYAEPYTDIHLQQPLELPNCLFNIQIWYVELDEDPFPVLEKLPILGRLCMYMCYNGEKMVCSSSGFPKLATLYLEGFPHFTDWEVEQGALQNLKVLDIKECALSKVPDAIPKTADVRIRKRPVTRGAAS